MWIPRSLVCCFARSASHGLFVKHRERWEPSLLCGVFPITRGFAQAMHAADADTSHWYHTDDWFFVRVCHHPFRLPKHWPWQNLHFAQYTFNFNRLRLSTVSWTSEDPSEVFCFFLLPKVLQHLSWTRVPCVCFPTSKLDFFDGTCASLGERLGCCFCVCCFPRRSCPLRRPDSLQRNSCLELWRCWARATGDQWSNRFWGFEWDLSGVDVHLVGCSRLSS